MPGLLTAAYVLALITLAALARADFRRYSTRRTGRIPAQKPQYPAFEFANGNRLLYNYPGTIGGKNGFTDAARHTFIGAAKHGSRRLVVTFMFGEHRPTHISEQAARMLDWGFALKRSLPSVGVLVDPADPGALPAAGAPSPTGSPPPEPSRSAAAPPAGAGPADSGGLPIAVLAGGIGALVLLAWGGVAVARRRR